MAASQYIGVVCSVTTGKIIAVVNPDDDSELDNPRWLLWRWSPTGTEKIETDGMTMVKVNRDIYNTFVSMAQVAAHIGAKE